MEHKSYAEAKAVCIWHGKKLVEPKSSQANNVTTQLAQSQGINRFWIGVNDFANEGIFVYNSSGETIVYENWNSGEPNNFGSGEDCIEIGDGGYWNDNFCTKKFPFVCENLH